MSELRTRFGRLVAGHRKRAGLTQDQLAQAAGLSVDMISRIEAGATGARFPTIEKLAEALRVDPAELFTSDFSGGGPKSGQLAAMTAKLSALSDADLAWLSSVIEVVLRRR
jgi:transcriptional regulator with XRE-family HTH domain